MVTDRPMYQLNKDEILTLIKSTFIPFDKMKVVEGFTCFDREGPIWDVDKLKELPLEKLEVLWFTVRRWEGYGRV